MRLLTKLLKKLVILAILMALAGYAAKYGWRFAMQASGVPVSSEESDLMSTVFSSATRLVSGSAKKDQLASELSDKLYAGRGNAQEMRELGIELVGPRGSPSAAPNGAASPDTRTANDTSPAAGLPGAKSPLDDLKKRVPTTLLGKLRDRLGAQGVGLALVPVAFAGMIAVRRFRRRPSKMDEFMPLVTAMQQSGDSEPYDMQHAVQSLGAEDFELLVALVYQRQGYRVSMSAGQSGGRGGDFILARKAERMLVQCKKLACDHRVAVERVREFHEAMVTAGLTRGLYVASCGFTWDARHVAKTRGITLINARTLDQLLTAAREEPDEDLLTVARWAPKLMQKATLTPALCPTCDAPMDEIMANGQSVWLCSQRPDCRGRRNARKHRKPVPGSAPLAAVPAAAVGKGSLPPKPERAENIPAKRSIPRDAAPKDASSKTAVPETAPAPEPEEFPPATLKSVVPRKRSPRDGKQDRAGVDLTAKPPITGSVAAAIRKAAAGSLARSKAGGKTRPEARK